ncbi:hypothetical protein Rhopal_002321-T1 [Rhodotorula paludigena]|uniref:Uncharacterized protein n=1 Tax=Rhodotorula paludigena TaxID=86838 RepID=A0AAV5G9R3_9BASI|nr:hypothetical protein Rhopal_002321-T1 [Rhodotorula paludigena]
MDTISSVGHTPELVFPGSRQLARKLTRPVNPPQHPELEVRAALLLAAGRYVHPDCSEDLSTPDTAEQAQHLVYSLLTDPPHIRLPLLRHILSVSLPPSFKSHPKINPETGRVLARPRGGDSGLNDWFDESEADARSWRRQAGLASVVKVIIEALEPGEVEDVWPLLLPPLLAYLDDFESGNKLVGMSLLDSLLDKTDESLLRRTGVGKVFEKSLENAFSALSDPLSPRLLARAHPVALKLLNQQHPPPPPSRAADDSARFDALCTLLSSSVVHTWEFKSSHVALETVSCAALPALLDALRGGSIRFLQILVPHLCELLSGTATSGGTGEGTWTGETVEMMRQAAKALEAVVRNAKPRMARWEGRINAAIGMCWVAVRESEGARRLGEADGQEALQHLKEALRSIARALDEILSTSLA